MTNQDYEQKKRECWEEFRIKNPAFNDMLGRKIFNQIYDRAYALGKQEKDADTVIQGWAARDSDGNLFMYSTKPERDEESQLWMGRCANFDLRNTHFPDLTWEDDPIEVEIIIKRKKK